jgi:hypothetical protein
MKLTLSTVHINVERRYALDEPVEIDVPGARYRATQFVTVTRTYEYGEIEQEFLVHAQLLKKDGTPDKREPKRDITLRAPTGQFHAILPDPRTPFIDALNDAVE